jgi:hypothetical protein
MKKCHQIFKQWTSAEVFYLSQLGVRAQERRMWVTIEDEDLYFTIKNHFAELNVKYLEFDPSGYYVYSKKEILGAPYCLLTSASHGCGYPQPENSYLLKTFDVSQMCQQCHVGKVQNQPFRVSKLSKSGFWSFFAWELDTYFVSDEIYESVFAPYNIQRMPVVLTSGKTAKGVTQLIFPVIEESLDLYAYRYEICPNCGWKKYLPGEEDLHPFFPLHQQPLHGAYKIKELKGQGWQVRQPILLCSEIVHKLLSMKLIDYQSLIPCTQDIERYWGPKSDYIVNNPK